MDDAKPRTPLGPELPQQLDPDFYREARLHIARLRRGDYSESDRH